jgi:hypothetical protein
MKGLAANALSRLKRRDLLESRAFIDGEWLSHDATLPARRYPSAAGSSRVLDAKAPAMASLNISNPNMSALAISRPDQGEHHDHQC